MANDTTTLAARRVVIDVLVDTLLRLWSARAPGNLHPSELVFSSGESGDAAPSEGALASKGKPA
jgi:hypothetical protein